MHFVFINSNDITNQTLHSLQDVVDRKFQIGLRPFHMFFPFSLSAHIILSSGRLQHLVHELFPQTIIDCIFLLLLHAHVTVFSGPFVLLEN